MCICFLHLYFVSSTISPNLSILFIFVSVAFLRHSQGKGTIYVGNQTAAENYTFLKWVPVPPLCLSCPLLSSPVLLCIWTHCSPADHVCCKMSHIAFLFTYRTPSHTHSTHTHTHTHIHTLSHSAVAVFKMYMSHSAAGYLLSSSSLRSLNSVTGWHTHHDREYDDIIFHFMMTQLNAFLSFLKYFVLIYSIPKLLITSFDFYSYTIVSFLFSYPSILLLSSLLSLLFSLFSFLFSSALRGLGITRVVNCTNGVSKIPNFHEDKLLYYTFTVGNI